MKFKNTLYTNDNLFILNGMNSKSVDLIYLDPPFNSKRFYSAPIGTKAAGATFKDMWTWADVDEAYLEGMVNEYKQLPQFISTIGTLHGKAMMSYITYMTQRMIQMHRVLKDTGSIYLHCDPTASHYLKIVMDMLFGEKNFRNEIIWCYKKWTNAGQSFQHNHDIILWYSKSQNTGYTFNKLYAEGSLHYEKGWHTNTIKGNGERIAQLVVYDKEKAKNKIESGGYDKVVYREEKKKVALPDWWEIPIINSQAKERTGYPTQKPLALLERIIEASSNKGDIVLDPFCGCATTCVAAQNLNRKWIGIDVEKRSAKLVIERLSGDFGLFNDFVHRRDIPQRTDIKIEKPNLTVKGKLYKMQDGMCNGCAEAFDLRHFEIDHIVPRAKGGGDYMDNYQLLCGNCNRIKGDRPMEYLQHKIKAMSSVKKTLTFGDAI